MKRIIPIITYIILAINTLYVFLLCLNICLYEVDLFLPIWIGSVIAIHTILVGLGLSIYALVQKDNPVFRKVALIWNGSLIVLLVLTFYVLPNGTNRIPNGMEKQYMDNHDAIIHLCRYATDSLSLPDSTALVITKNSQLQTRKVIGRNRLISYPVRIFTEDTVFDIDASQAQRIIQLHKAANIGEFTVFMPDSLVNIHFTNRGFGKYWYEIPHHPYLEQEMYFQLNNKYACPYLPEVSFQFAGGATSHDTPFPKVQFLQSHHIDSTYIYNLFH
ncbi:MAG: hypothetical protein IKG86_00320 [Paludibacteraceae bacterium]|nr:hypothetical protein [Paludibacteraceae bacterium]